MLLNNELDDFTAAPGASNAFGLVGFEANLPGPGKRPLSSMSPTIVLKDGKPVLVTGSPGGSRIISTVLQVIVNVLDYHMDVAAAVAAPRLHHQWLPDEVRIERGFPDDVLAGLKAKGHHVVEPMGQTSANSIAVTDERIARRARSAHPRRGSGGAIDSPGAICLTAGIGVGFATPAQAGRAGPIKAGQNIFRGNIHHEHTAEPSGAIEIAADRRHQPARVLSRHEPAGTADVLGLRVGLGARRHGLHDLSAGDRHHHHAVEGRSRHRRPRRHRDAASLRGRRLARRLSRRPHRPGQNPAVHDPVVLVLLAGLRRRAEFRSAPDRARGARPRLWRRMGRGRGADGRGDPPAISRTRGRFGAIGLGGRLGPCGAGAGDPVFLFPGGNRMALDVRDRRAAGAAGVLSPPLRHRAGDRRRHPRQAGGERATSRRCGRSSPARSSRPPSWRR